MKSLLPMALGAGILAGECLPVSSNRVTGRDLALANAGFSGLPATLSVGFAPAPGTSRIFTATELQRIARANGIQGLTPADLCFEIPMAHLDGEQIAASMRRALPADALLRLVEVQDLRVPAGGLEFPIEGLEPPLPSDHGTQVWRGSVRYAETRRMSIRVRVEIAVERGVVVAARDLPAGMTIGPGAVRLETRRGPLPVEKAADRIEDVEGHILKRAIAAGSVVPLAVLAEAPAVRRGDSVSVEVESGRAHLRFVAIAENAAREGDMVELRNPLNGKTFRARLDAGARAVMVVGAAGKL